MKVADFGASKEVDRIKYSVVGTLGFQAPEMLKNEQYGRPVDIYSFGMIMWQVLHPKQTLTDEMKKKLNLKSLDDLKDRMVKGGKNFMSFTYTHLLCSCS